ncbi:MAG: response regulator [Anaerolineae bacterium]|nr:response regulator [Anaerolineae bacterium]
MAGELVLVVDDRDDSLQFLTDYILQPNGYRFITAKNGARGLELALSQDPALIIMDLKMPKMTGLEVLATLQERDVHIPVILMTFHGSEETAVQAFRLGARDYIIKPYDTTEMLQAIDRALTEVRLRRERDELHQGIMKINRQLEGRVKELQIIYSIGKSVTAMLDVEKLLSRIVQAGLYLTGAEEGSLLLLDKQTGDLYMRAARGLGEKFARGFRVKIQDSIAGQVVKTGEPYLDAGDVQTLKVKTGYLVKSLLYVPLKLGTNVIGVLLIDNKISPKAFTENDIYLLQALADYAAIAIHNAQLYETVKDFNQELEERVKERTRELRETQRQLVQSEKLASIGQLAAGVAHEINNPIGVMLGFAQVLLKRVQDDDPMHRPLSIIEREGLRCKGIVQSLLNFSHQSNYKPARVNINDVVDASLDLVKPQANGPNIKIAKEYASNLPEVVADSNQLQQVFVNILINAHQVLSDGGEIHIKTHQVDQQVHVVFIDTGPGIPEENLSRVFDPFFTTKEVGEGTGLGLYVSYGIVEQHGGLIEAESDGKNGATFTVRLPVAPSGRHQKASVKEEQEII